MVQVMYVHPHLGHTELPCGITPPHERHSESPSVVANAVSSLIDVVNHSILPQLEQM